MSRIFPKLRKAFEDPERLELYAILLQDELCVDELDGMVDLSRHDLEEHLRVLLEADLLVRRRNDGQAFYQARSNPVLEAREWLLRTGVASNWHEFYRQVRRAKQKNLRGNAGSRYAPTA